MTRVVFIWMTVPSGAPADMASGLTSAPAITSAPAKAKELGAGNASVSTQTGNLTYNYPIVTPPGRGKAHPNLALTYSSNAPLYGGVAAGWALSGVPGVYEDTSLGRMKTRHPMYQFSEPKNDDRFISSLVGGRRLILTNEPKDADVWRTYRAKTDETYTRFDRMNDTFSSFRWRARTSDGMTYEFGGAAAAAACPGIISESHAPLTLATDAFGSTVRYSYALANGECRLTTITYGANAAAGVADFAEISFSYAAPLTCNGVMTGSQTDLRTGTKIITGTSRLVWITSKAIDPGTAQVVHTRTISLNYDSASESCIAQHSPVRLLTSITESASGVDSPLVTLPPVTFTYGAPATPWNDQKSGSSLGLQALSWGKRFPGDLWPTLDGTLIDLNGDGRLDKVLAQTSNGTCQAVWQPNMGMSGNGLPTYGDLAIITLPRLPWENNALTPDPSDEGCSLNGQRTQYRNTFGTPQPESYLAYRWIDMNADGLTDLVAAIHHSSSFYDLEKPGEPFNAPLGLWPSCSGELPNTCNELSSDCMTRCWEGSFNWSCAATCIVQANPLECVEHMAPAPPSYPPWTLLAGSMQRPPRKAYQRCGGRYPWAIYYNEGNGAISSTASIKYFPKPLDSETSNAAITGNHFVNETDANLDFDGDGKLDVIVTNKTPTPSTMPFYWTVWLSAKGDGPVGQHEYQVLTRSDASLHRTAEVIDPYTEDKDIFPVQGLLDLNSDGLPDQWLRSSFNSVRLHDGLGYPASTEVHPPEGIRLGTRGWLHVLTWNTNHTWAVTANRWTRDRLVDADADGRVDVLNTDGTAPVPPSGARLHFNVGGNYGAGYTAYPSSAPLGDLRGKVTAEGNESSNGWYQRADFADLDNDGLTEFVQIEGGTMTRTVHTRTNDAPPRLMRTIDNGRGAVTTVSYDSMHGATVTHDRTQASRTTPRNGWVVQSMSLTDAAASPSTTTTTSYLYKHPRYLEDDEYRFSFRGFDEVTTTSQSGAKTVQRYSYWPDWSGRLTDTVVLDAAGNTVSVSSTSWQGFTTFVGSWIDAFHPTQTRSYTCGAAQTGGGPEPGLLRERPVNRAGSAVLIRAA